MGILSTIIGPVFDTVGDVVSEVVVDKDKRNQLKADLQRLEMELTDKAEQRVHEEMIAQIEVNKVEAAHTNLFVAGWRPAVGWVGVTSLAYSFILAPIGEFVARLSGYTGNFPVLQTESILFLLSGMLGFGGLRTWEKIKGVVPAETSDLSTRASRKPEEPMTVMSEQKKTISDKGLDLIKKFEGLRLTAYLCPANVLTIGYGHTGPDVKKGMRITNEQADELLRKDVARFEEGVRAAVGDRCTQGQFDALVSFSFNLGLGNLMSSTLLKKHKAMDYAGAANEFLRWNKAGGKVLSGLTKRRAEERTLYLS